MDQLHETRTPEVARRNPLPPRRGRLSLDAIACNQTRAAPGLTELERKEIVSMTLMGP